MDNNFAKLSNFQAYKKLPTSFSEANLKGQIYELYCYNILLKNHVNINIIKSGCMKKEKYGNFSYNKLGKINYHSNNIHLAEFDILGIKENNIYFFEITMSELNKKTLKNEINRKTELLKKIFLNHEIIFTLILPKEIQSFVNYNIMIINEPVYNKYMNSEYFKIDTKVKECKSLEYLTQIATEYDYINEIIEFSRKYFSSNNKEYLFNQHLIERIYDLDNITKNSFSYYSIENRNYGTIRINGNKIFRDGKIIEGRKKCNDEIKIIRNILKANGQIV